MTETGYGFCEEVRLSFIDKIIQKIRGIKYVMKNLMYKIGVSFIKWSNRDTNCVKHAKEEFKSLGWDKDEDIQKLICDQVCELLYLFSAHRHSGCSAPYAINMFRKLASFEPLGPLTGEDSEWAEVVDGKMWQNKRCSHVFKTTDGKAYDSEGRIFREPDGFCFTNRDSKVYIDFPYTPKTEYIDVGDKECTENLT